MINNDLFNKDIKLKLNLKRFKEKMKKKDDNSLI